MIRQFVKYSFVLAAMAGTWNPAWAQTGSGTEPKTGPAIEEASFTEIDWGLFGLAQELGITGDIAVSRASGAIEIASLSDVGKVSPDNAWPWASVSKQVVAAMVMRQVEIGAIDLDAEVSDYIDGAFAKAGTPTIRALLTHQSGLRNPNSSPVDQNGVPSFYSTGPTGPTGLTWCLEGREAPSPGKWTYNNCDFIVLGAVLESATGSSFEQLFATTIAQPAGLRATALYTSGDERSFTGIEPTYQYGLPRFGASGALVGPLSDMVRFGRALLDGKLLGDDALAQMWDGKPERGYIAFGQWAFKARLKGCDGAVRIIERRGGIGKYQTRHFILPEQDLVLAVAIEDANFEFGEIWTGAGVSYDLLGMAACGSAP